MCVGVLLAAIGVIEKKKRGSASERGSQGQGFVVPENPAASYGAHGGEFE